MQIEYCEACGGRLPEVDSPPGTVRWCEVCTAKRAQPPGTPTEVRAQPISRKSSATRLPAINAPLQVKPGTPSRGAPGGGTLSPSPTPDAAALQAPSWPPDPAGAPPTGSTYFYFCEKCGKRVTHADLQAGRGRDKQLRGVFCESCVTGAQTKPFEALSQGGIGPHEQKKRAGADASVSARLPQARVRTDRPPAPAGGVVVLGIGVVVAVIAVLMLSGVWAPSGDTGNGQRPAGDKRDRADVAARLEQERRRLDKENRRAESARREADRAKRETERLRLDVEKRKAEEERNALESARWASEAEAKKKAEGTDRQNQAAAVRDGQELAHPQPAVPDRSQTGIPNREVPTPSNPSNASSVAQQKNALSLFSAVFKETAPLLAKNSFADALALLGRKAKDPAFADAAELLKQEQTDIEAVVEMRKEAVEALRKKVGEQVSLKKGNAVIKGKVVASTKPDVVAVNMGGVELSLRADQIHVDDIEMYAPKGGGADAAGGTPTPREGGSEDLRRRGLLFLYAGEVSKAKDYFATAAKRSAGVAQDKAGGTPALPTYLDRITALEMGEIEAAALKAWENAEKLFAARNMKSANDAYEAFQKQHGQTKTAAKQEALLKQRYDAIEAALGPPPIPPGGVISINFTNTGDKSAMLEPGTAAGAVSRANWNNYAYDVSTYGLNPKDDTGTTLASTYVNYRISAAADYRGNLSYRSTVGNDYLMRYFCGNDESAVYTQRTLIRVSGLPASFTAAGYSIYVYSDWNGDNIQQSIAVVRKFDLGTSILDAANPNAGMTVLSTATIVDSTDWLGTGNPTGIFTEGADGSVGNYLVFRNQTASEFAIFPYAARGTRVAINGIQIVANSRFRAAAPSPPRGGGAHRIGDTGPGGGIIFYVGSFRSNGVACTYLEAAPSSWSRGADPSCTWATNVNSNQTTTVPGIAIGTAIGTGYANSVAIVNQPGNVAASCAAVAARNYAGGRKSDWFLPSKDELAQLYKQRAVADLPGGITYWSSSEFSATNAWILWDNGGLLSNSGKDWNARVRPIRAF